MKKAIKRALDLPNKSFLLFGPRGTGKSTLLAMKLKSDLNINLLRSSQYIPLAQDPSLLEQWTAHLKPGQWVVLDEVQKIPALLDEVHRLYEEKGLHFALSGSSARKLKRGGANLLAGRALQRYLFPFVFSEFSSLTTIDEVIDWGTLPGVIVDPLNRIETLATYVETYLKQELIEEGIVRKLDPFMRFLRTAGQYNAQILNVENLARESHVGRTTVDKYFEIIEDTLIGFRLPALPLGLQAKEVSHPKFYFFDCGVARACAGYLNEEIDSVWRGFAFETYVIHEVRAYNSYSKKVRDLFYYKVSGGNEVDLLIETSRKTLSKPQKLVALEIKSSKKWDSRWSHSLQTILDSPKSPVYKAVAVYRGKQILTQGKVSIYPVEEFLKLLYSGDIF